MERSPTTGHVTPQPQQAFVAHKDSSVLLILYASQQTGGMGQGEIPFSLFEVLAQIRRGLRRNVRVIVLLVILLPRYLLEVIVASFSDKKLYRKRRWRRMGDALRKELE